MAVNVQPDPEETDLTDEAEPENSNDGPNTSYYYDSITLNTSTYTDTDGEIHIMRDVDRENNENG